MSGGLGGRRWRAGRALRPGRRRGRGQRVATSLLGAGHAAAERRVPARRRVRPGPGAGRERRPATARGTASTQGGDGRGSRSCLPDAGRLGGGCVPCPKPRALPGDLRAAARRRRRRAWPGRPRRSSRRRSPPRRRPRGSARLRGLGLLGRAHRAAGPRRVPPRHPGRSGQPPARPGGVLPDRRLGPLRADRPAAALRARRRRRVRGSSSRASASTPSAVLAELGFDRREIDALLAAKVARLGSMKYHKRWLRRYRPGR